MIACVDTNVLVRHLTDDPPAQARRATALLENAERSILADLVVAELVYVLESYYDHPRQKVAEAVQSLLALSSIAVADHDLVLRAVELYECTRRDFAQACHSRGRTNRGGSPGVVRSRARSSRHDRAHR